MKFSVKKKPTLILIEISLIVSSIFETNIFRVRFLSLATEINIFQIFFLEMLNLFEVKNGRCVFYCLMSECVHEVHIFKMLLIHYLFCFCVVV
jgi:hypothetical protein